MELPQEPPPGLLMSMALRYDHGLACPGYYDTMPSYPGETHAKRLEHVLRVMQQLYEEVSGHGFYRPKREAEYAAMLPANAEVSGAGTASAGLTGWAAKRNYGELKWTKKNSWTGR